MAATKIFALCFMIIFSISVVSALSPTVYYNFDETSGSLIEKVKGVYNGTVSGATQNVSGKLNRSYRFDGINDFVNLTKILPLNSTENLSINFWIKTNDTVATDSIIRTQTGSLAWAVLFRGVNGIDFQVQNKTGYIVDSGVSGTAMNNDSWVMMTAIINSSGSHIYQNGVLKNSSLPLRSGVTPDMDTIIGSNSGASEFFNGTIDEVSIFNTSISSSDIQLLYNNGNALTYPFFSVTLNSPTSIYPSPAIFNATIIGSNLTNATLYLWYPNGTLNATEFISLSGSRNESIFSKTIIGLRKWNVYACSEPICDFASSNISIGYKVNSEIYNTTSYISNSETFSLNITLNSGITFSSANLTYDGNTYEGTVYSDGGGNIIISKTISVPSVAGSKSFYWTLYLDSDEITTTTRTQTLLSFTSLSVAESCGSGLSRLFYYDIRNENNDTLINSTVNYNIQYGLEGNATISVLNGSLVGVYNISICYNSTNPIYIGYGELQYFPFRNTTELYPNRRFYLFQNVRASTISANGTLYLLPTADATEFQFTLADSYASPLPNRFIAIMRWYPSLNSYKIVEMGKTDNNGQTTFNVKTATEDYRIAHYYLNGTLVEMYSPVRFICVSSPCSYSLFQSSFSQDYLDLSSLQQSFTFNHTTNIFTYSWNDASQETQSMNITVFKDYSSGSSAVCSSVGYGFTGIVTCNVTGQNGNLRAEIYRTASPSIPINQLIVSVGEALSDMANGKTIGLLIAFTLSVFLFIVGIFSPVVAIILGIVGLIPALYFGGISSTVFVGIIILGVVIIHFLRRT